ncbi:hypothetical protein BDQ17DRAFT_1240074, partial [Cyathus striatus]
MSADFTLNTEQHRAFSIVAWHSLSHTTTQLRMYLGGQGGTGKSQVINCLRHYFTSLNQVRRFRLTSFTGVAAQNILGMTLHAALSLNQSNKNGFSTKAQRDLVAMWEGVDYLFIDEVSMVGCSLLVQISNAL